MQMLRMWKTGVFKEVLPYANEWRSTKPEGLEQPGDEVEGDAELFWSEGDWATHPRDTLGHEGTSVWGPWRGELQLVSWSA